MAKPNRRPDAPLRDDIARARAELLSRYIAYLQHLDESDPRAWQEIIKTVREAGLEKDLLCRELSCAWSTILRWEAGQTVPGPFGRQAMKAKLIKLVEQQGSRQSPLSPAAV